MSQVRSVVAMVVVLAVGIGWSPFLVSEADALILCAKKKNPNRVKLRGGDACRKTENPIPLDTIPELKGPQGDKGDKGDTGDAGAQGPAGVLGFYSRSGMSSISAFVCDVLTVNCDAGDDVTGGGLELSTTELDPQISKPDGTTGWTVGVCNTAASARDLTVYALCADLTP